MYGRKKKLNKFKHVNIDDAGLLLTEIDRFEIYSTGVSSKDWFNLTVIDPGPYTEDTKKAKWRLGYSLTEKRFAVSRDFNLALQYEESLLTGLLELIKAGTIVEAARQHGESSRAVLMDKAKALGLM